MQDTIKSSTHKVEKMLPTTPEENGYGWKKKVGITEETREQKQERMFFKAVKEKEK
jgi:hypothetical protein